MNLQETIRKYLDLRADKAQEAETIANIKADAAFRGARLWVLVFAIFIASLGLNVNSTAVIIGAMLISPLMGPIVGMGLAVGTGDVDLLRSSAKNFAVATLASVLTATLYFLISPFKELQSELLARTSPTLYDVMIAFFGGAAGIVAIATGGKGNVIPGVAIATALMPPLCTAGYGLATGQWLFFLGAFYLFFINTVFISLATYIGVRLMGFQQHEERSVERARSTTRILFAVVLLTMVPAAIMTFSLVRQSIFNQNVSRYVNEVLAWPGTQILSQHVNRDAQTLTVAVIGREVDEAQVAAARQRLADFKLGDYQLSVIQGTQSDSLLALVGRLESTKTTYTQQAAQQRWQISELETALKGYERYEQIAAQLAPELQVLFPQIHAISLAHTKEQRIDTALATPITIAVVTLLPHHTISNEQTTQLRDWLKARTEADTMQVVVHTEHNR